MKITEIREMAKQMGLKQAGRLKKGELIRRIQLAEGNFDCYESPGRLQCPQKECCWRKDCLGSKPE